MDSATKILDNLLGPATRCLTPEAASRLTGLVADEVAQQRMDLLAEKCRDGTLSEDERAEYGAYVSAANVLAILEAKAGRMMAPRTKS